MVRRFSGQVYCPVSAVSEVSDFPLSPTRARTFCDRENGSRLIKHNGFSLTSLISQPESLDQFIGGPDLVGH